MSKTFTFTVTVNEAPEEAHPPLKRRKAKGVAGTSSKMGVIVEILDCDTDESYGFFYNKDVRRAPRDKVGVFTPQAGIFMDDPTVDFPEETINGWRKISNDGEMESITTKRHCKMIKRWY